MSLVRNTLVVMSGGMPTVVVGMLAVSFVASLSNPSSAEPQRQIQAAQQQGEVQQVPAQGVDAQAVPTKQGPATESEKAVVVSDEVRRAARDRGLTWLHKNQKPDGSWGNLYSLAVTSFACLAQIAAAEEPFADDAGKATVRGLNFILAQQTDGRFKSQGHTWIHGQGFATLALAEAYGKSLTCKVEPDLDMNQVKDVVAKAVEVIAEAQSTSGGWWYHANAPGSHEGSTTCCAVQALVAADNYGIKIDKAVLSRGFEYLKKCQNPDGGFDYMMGPGTSSMKEGTAGGVATLGLMKKFDYAVMMKGYQYLLKITPSAISSANWPYYGHFYGVMGMRLLGQEFRSLREATSDYASGALGDLLSWQQDNGSWPIKAWVKSHGEDAQFATAWAALTLGIDDGRVSIFNRWPPGEQPPVR